MKINYAAVKASPEYSSAAVRIALWFLTTLFIGLAMWANYYEPAWELYIYFTSAFFIYTAIVYISILYKPYIPIRPYITIPFDVTSIGFCMMFTDDGPFSPFFLFYPWYFVSYGARYGRGPLFAAAWVSILGFIAVLWLSDTWYSHVYDVIAYMVFLAILPLYLNMMLHRLNAAREEADRANRAKSEFLAAMSHEIRTPMSGIVGVTSLLKNTNMDANQEEYVSALEESSAALNALIDDVLDLSKIEAGKYTLDRKRFNLSKTLYGVAQMFTATANAKGVELFFFYAPQLPTYVYGDSKRLRQIVLNLVSNAVKFTEQGQVYLYVCRAKKQIDDNKVVIRFEVRDTGPGISAEQKKMIFEPFYQASNQHTTQQSGTGLGTTISANLVRLMHGTIDVETKLDKGSTFWFEIPWEYSPEETIIKADVKLPMVIIYESNQINQYILEQYFSALNWPYQIIATEETLLNTTPTLAEQQDKFIVMLSELTCDSECEQIARKLKEKFSGRVSICRIIHLTQLHNINSEKDELFDQYLLMPIALHRLRTMMLDLVDIKTEKTVAQDELTNSIVSRFLHVLVAEDSPINAKVITTFLTQDGHRVDHVENGELALQSLRDQQYDMVFMDMRMPEMDGLEATRQWRSEEADERHVPIIALTANATTEDKNNCLAAGMDDFLSKPVTQEQLRETINNVDKFS